MTLVLSVLWLPPSSSTWQGLLLCVWWLTLLCVPAAFSLSLHLWMSSGRVLPLGHWGFCYFSKPNHQERAFCRANTGKKTRDLRVVALALDYLNCSPVLSGIQPGSLKGVGKSLSGTCLEAGIFTCQPVISRPILGCGGGGSCFPDEET